MHVLTTTTTATTTAGIRPIAIEATIHVAGSIWRLRLMAAIVTVSVAAVLVVWMTVRINWWPMVRRLT